MARSASVGRRAWCLVALAVAACAGKTVHLGDECLHAQVKAEEVLWIGDSWILVPGSQHTRVRDLAQATGAIGAGDDYEIDAAPAAFMSDVAAQYATREAGPTKVKVLIMDGGTWDTLRAMGAEAAVSSVIDTFGRFLAQVAADGTVEHIIYFLMPELPSIYGVAALRQPLKDACAASAVPCHFIDLQPIWAANAAMAGHAEFTTTDGILPTDAGAHAIADAIWAVMQETCIAQ